VAETRWRAADPATLRVVSLEGLTALYHRPSGQTHLVTEPVPEILSALRGMALTVPELKGALGADQDVVGDAEALAARLEELAEAGLVSQA
jgi:PqqD family protein of HPr-rel-A system